MVADPELAVRLTRLQVELRHDLAAMRARAAELRELLDRWNRTGTLPRPELVLVAVNLHGWYTALETGLERIARLLDQTVPTGPTWHVDLVAQMQLEVAGVRPAVFPMAAASALHELRKFRHFFRNAYVLALDPLKVRTRAHDLDEVADPVAADVDRLLAHVEAVLASLR